MYMIIFIETRSVNLRWIIQGIVISIITLFAFKIGYLNGWDDKVAFDREYEKKNNIESLGFCPWFTKYKSEICPHDFPKETQ